jgi:hypothetical protein
MMRSQLGKEDGSEYREEMELARRKQGEEESKPKYKKMSLW